MSLAWLTPDTLPETTVCRVIQIPDDPFFIYAVNGALLNLTYHWHWEKHGAVEPDQAAERMAQLLQEYFESECNMGSAEGLIGSLVIVLATGVYPDNVLRCNGGVYNRVDYPLFYDYLVANNSPLVLDADTFENLDIAATSVFVNTFGQTIPAYWCWIVK